MPHGLALAFLRPQQPSFGYAECPGPCNLGTPVKWPARFGFRLLAAVLVLPQIDSFKRQEFAVLPHEGRGVLPIEAIVPCCERAIEFSNVVAYDQVDDLLRLRAVPPTSDPDHIAISHERVVQARAKPPIVAHAQKRKSAAMVLLLVVPRRNSAA